MRFRTKERPRGLLRPSDQKRLALMIGGFGLILLCFTIVRRPAFWNGMFPEDPTVQTPTTPDGAIAQRKEIVTAKQGMHHDEFVVGATAADNDAQNESDVVSVTVNRPVLAELESTDAPVSASGLRQVPDKLLKTIKDDVIGVHSTESQAYYAAMKMASVMIEKNASKAPKGAYALFMDSPDSSRGVAWKMSGRLRRLSAVKGSANTVGVGRLYDAWLTSDDSGDGLVHVVTMATNSVLTERLNRLAERNIEAGLTNRLQARVTGNTIEFPGNEAPEVQFTGYFFKIEAYASKQESGISRAPLFVAGVLHEIPPVVASSTRAEQMTPYMGWLALFVSCGVLLMIWSFTVSDVAHAQTRTHQLTKLPAHASFEDIRSETIVETLSKLEAAGPSTS